MFLARFYKILLIIETTIIALGVTGFFVFYNYRAGVISFPPTFKNVVSVIIGFLFFVFLVFGLLGWVILFDAYKKGH